MGGAIIKKITTESQNSFLLVLRVMALLYDKKMAVSRRWVIGIDEAGRGPLAGPVTLAAVACPRTVARAIFKGIKDSKHLTLKAREVWLKKIELKRH